MDNTDKQQKKVLMLHFAGPEVNEIFDTLEDSEAETDYKAAVRKTHRILRSTDKYRI